MSVSGSASMAWENYSGVAKNSTKAFSMGNQLTFSGSGELDNGLTVGLSFIIDQADNTGTADTPFDSHSVSVSSDALGTLVFHGEGGDSAQNAVGDTAAGNIWDNFDARTTGNAALKESNATTDMIHYTLPNFVEGVAVSASYVPSGGTDQSDSAYAIVYTGLEGLTASYGQGSSDQQAAGLGASTADADTTSMKVSYVIGSITAAYSSHDHDHGTATSGQEATSWKLSYTVSDAISISYGHETIDSKETADSSDAEFSKIAGSYTSGGMTVSASFQDGENMSYTTATSEDEEYYGLSLSFAF